MNQQQIEIVQRTFDMAAPMADEVATCFYTRLFELDPGLRPMFRGDMKQQGQKLMTVLALAVRGLSKPETIIEAVRRLGQRHAGYGVQPQHYTTVGEALLGTLAELFGPAFNDEVRQAWTSAYVLLATIMQEAAAERDAHLPIREAVAA